MWVAPAARPTPSAPGSTRHRHVTIANRGGIPEAIRARILKSVLTTKEASGPGGSACHRPGHHVVAPRRATLDPGLRRHHLLHPLPVRVSLGGTPSLALRGRHGMNAAQRFESRILFVDTRSPSSTACATLRKERLRWACVHLCGVQRSTSWTPALRRRRLDTHAGMDGADLLARVKSAYPCVARTSYRHPPRDVPAAAHPSPTRSDQAVRCQRPPSATSDRIPARPAPARNPGPRRPDTSLPSVPRLRPPKLPAPSQRPVRHTANRVSAIRRCTKVCIWSLRYFGNARRVSRFSMRMCLGIELLKGGPEHRLARSALGLTTSR